MQTNPLQPPWVLQNIIIIYGAWLGYSTAQMQKKKRKTFQNSHALSCNNFCPVQWLQQTPLTSIPDSWLALPFHNKQPCNAILRTPSKTL